MGTLTVLIDVRVGYSDLGPTCLYAFLSLKGSIVVVTSCNFTASIATLGALRNPREVLWHPNCTQILLILFLASVLLDI